MAKVANAGEDHSYAVFVGGRDHLFVAHRTARLYHGRNPGLGRGVDTVAERVEGRGVGDVVDLAVVELDEHGVVLVVRDDQAPRRRREAGVGVARLLPFEDRED